MLSVPAPPVSVSLPTPPNRLSLPAPPDNALSKPSPVSLSLKADPKSASIVPMTRMSPAASPPVPGPDARLTVTAAVEAE